MALWDICPKCGKLVLKPHTCGWKFRLWKWCLGYGLDYSLNKSTRHRVTWVDKKRNGIIKKVGFALLIKHKGRYFLLDSKEFISVTEKFDGKDWYEVLFEGN